MGTTGMQSFPVETSQSHQGVPDNTGTPERQGSGQLDLAALNSEAGVTVVAEEGRSRSKPMKSLLRKMNPLAKKKDPQPDVFAELTPEIASVASRRG